jgi:hypothetical protein
MQSWAVFKYNMYSAKRTKSWNRDLAWRGSVPTAVVRVRFYGFVAFFSKLRDTTVFVLFPSWQVLFDTLTFKISLVVPPYVSNRSASGRHPSGSRKTPRPLPARAGCAEPSAQDAQMCAQFMKRCHSCIVRNQGRFRASRPRNVKLGVLFSSPLVRSCARGYHKPNTQVKNENCCARSAGNSRSPFSKGNFGDLISARFQPLSTPIGRFLEISDRCGVIG